MRIASEHHTESAFGAKLRAAENVTPQLMAESLDLSRRRLLAERLRERALHLDQLVDAGAWTDAALELVELELPLWHVRRIAYDAGEWFCALSCQRELPDWMDQAIEARHPNLALAILGAYVEAQRAANSSSSTSVPASPRRPEPADVPLCCDHFA
jgi:hypothetical protein